MMRRTSEHILDELLVIEAQGGSPRALERLAERWTGRLLAAAHHRTRDSDGAWDVVQESWLAICKGLRRLEDPALFGPWSRRIVANKSADWIRARQAGRRTGALESDPPARPAPDEGPITRLREALRRLPSERRELLALHYSEGLSVAAIAALLKVPEGTVKSRLHHTRLELKEIFQRSPS